MRNLLTLTPVVFLLNTQAQTPQSLHTFLTQAKRSDTSMVIVTISSSLKISENKPATVLLPKIYGPGHSIESYPREVYYQPKGEMSFLLYPRGNLLADVQPHVFLGITGLGTYLSSKLGLGLTSREYALSIGVIAGSYSRRLDAKADVSYRAKSFEEDKTFGGYLNIDQEYISWFCLLAKERTFGYHEIGLTARLGSMLDTRFVPTGIGLEFKSVTFLGTGFGLSYTAPNQHHKIEAVFCIPDPAETKRQRRFYNFIGPGVSVNWQIQAF